MNYMLDTDIIIYWLNDAIPNIQNKMINDSDLFIASIAISNKMRLVTNNDKHFKRIEDLKIENWI
jgi:predicted nucleic acid-binding protein